MLYGDQFLAEAMLNLVAGSQLQISLSRVTKSAQSLIEDVSKYLDVTPKLSWLPHLSYLKIKQSSQQPAMMLFNYSCSWTEIHSTSAPKGHDNMRY